MDWIGSEAEEVCPLGYMKQLLMEQEAQGWKYVDEALVACEGCVAEPALRQWIALQGADEARCSCGRLARPVRVNSLFVHINEWLSARYEEAADSLPWDGREGGYQGTVIDSTDLAYDLIENEELRQLFIHSFSDRQLCPRITVD